MPVRTLEEYAAWKAAKKGRSPDVAVTIPRVNPHDPSKRLKIFPEGLKRDRVQPEDPIIKRTVTEILAGKKVAPYSLRALKGAYRYMTGAVVPQQDTVPKELLRHAANIATAPPRLAMAFPEFVYGVVKANIESGRVALRGIPDRRRSKEDVLEGKYGREYSTTPALDLGKQFIEPTVSAVKYPFTGDPKDYAKATHDPAMTVLPVLMALGMGMKGRAAVRGKTKPVRLETEAPAIESSIIPKERVPVLDEILGVEKPKLEVPKREVKPVAKEPAMAKKPSAKAQQEAFAAQEAAINDMIDVLEARKLEPTTRFNPAKSKAIDAEILELGRQKKDLFEGKTPPIDVTLTEPVVKVPTGDVARLNKADTDLIRRETKLSELPEHEVKTWKATLAEARETGQVGKAADTAREVINSKRPVTDVEHAGMTLRLAELKNEYNQSIADVAKQAEGGNTTGVKIEQGRLNNILDQMDILTEARRLGGREAARALAMGRMGIDIHTYDIASVMQRATAIKGRRLKPKEAQAIQDIAKQYEVAEARVKELEAKNDAIIAENERLLAEKITKIESKARGVRKGLVTQRAGIKKQIAALGLRVNDIFGVTPEAAHLVGKLAVNYIKDGATTLSAVVKKVLADLPELTARDVYKALNTKDPKSIARVRSEITKRVADLKKQAELLLKIEKAEKGIFDQPTGKTSTVSLEVKRLQQQLRQLRKRAYKTIQKSDRLENAIRTINELQDQLDNHYRNIRTKREPDIGEIKELRDKISDLRKQLYVQDEIIKLKEQLRAGDFEIAEPKKMKPDSPELTNAKIDLSLLRKEVDSRVARLAPWTVGKVATEIVNTLRTLKATADVSGTGRQGMVLGVNTDPRIMATIQYKALRAAKDPRYAERIDMELRSSPYYYLAEKSGVHYTEWKTGKPLLKEEMFMSDIAERLPVAGKFVRPSNRHMVTYLNLLRDYNFKWYLDKAPNATHAELTAWADAGNVYSGRGNLGVFAKAANVLSLGFFAPRFSVSRFQTPYMMFKHMRTSRVRKYIAKDMVQTLGIGLSVLAMADYLGADIEGDPREPDWGKIKIGNTRIDIWGGLQQPMRLTLRLGLGITDKMGLTGRHLTKAEKQINPLDLISQFSIYKLAPVITVTSEFYRGKTIVGEPVEPTETMVNAITPMVIEDIRDAYEDAGLERALLSGGLNFLGISANTYRKRSGRGGGQSGGR